MMLNVLPRWLQSLDRQQLTYGCCLLLILALFTTKSARILLSLTPVALFVLALLGNHSAKKLRQFLHYRNFLALALLLLLHLLSFFYTRPENYSIYFKEVGMKLPLLLLPFSFAVLPTLDRKKWLSLYYLFVWLAFLTALFSTGKYLLHFSEVNAAYLHSKVLEVPANHVRYSLMTALAVVAGAELYWRKGYYWKTGKERPWLLFITLFLFLFLHILAVRSGLLALYLYAGLQAVYLFFGKRRYKAAILLGSLLLLMPVFSYYTLPTFHNKFYNTLEDAGRATDRTSANTYSLVGRVYAYETAMMVIKENPVLGVGIADVKSEIWEKYRKHYPEIAEIGYKLPHNQFQYELVAFGFIGLLVFLVCFYFPLFAQARHMCSLLLAHYFIITVSFLAEATLETQLGLMFSLVFILLPLYNMRRREDDASLNAPAAA